MSHCFPTCKNKRKKAKILFEAPGQFGPFYVIKGFIEGLFHAHVKNKSLFFAKSSSNLSAGRGDLKFSQKSKC